MSNSESRKKAAIIRRKQIAEKVPRFNNGQEAPLFIADVMLGRLAKWLRISGFDVLYSNQFSDDELVRISNSERRVLLSRDTRLLVRKTVRAFIHIESQDLEEQIRQVFDALKIQNPPSLLTRCISCNETLKEIARESVRGVVPPYVFETQNRFKLCEKCGRVFWAGTHRSSVIRSLGKIGVGDESGEEN